MKRRGVGQIVVGLIIIALLVLSIARSHTLLTGLVTGQQEEPANQQGHQEIIVVDDSHGGFTGTTNNHYSVSNGKPTVGEHKKDRLPLTLQDLLQIEKDHRAVEMRRCQEQNFTYYLNRVFPHDIMMADDNHLDDDTNEGGTRRRKIPKLIHILGEGRCMNQHMMRFLKKWEEFENHTIIYHDTYTKDKVMYEMNWAPYFPHLPLLLNCQPSATARGDLYRYLTVWAFGGIYTDLDNAPGGFNQTSIVAEDDAYFERERGGFMSQYFFATAPKHPIMYFALLQALKNTMAVTDISTQFVPIVTGPAAIKSAFLSFMKRPGNLERRWQRPEPGNYISKYDGKNVSIRVVPQELRRGALKGLRKKKAWIALGMNYYQKEAFSDEVKNKSCLEIMYLNRHNGTQF